MPYTLDQSYETGQDNADGSGIGNLRRAANNNTILGQSFTPSVGGFRGKIELYIKKVGSPTGNIWLEIRADGADPTVATLIDTSDNVDVSTVSGSYAYQPFIFSTPASLSISTEYWILLYGDYTEAVDVGVYWGIDTSSPAYAGGHYGRYGNGGAAWEDVTTYDGLFKEYITGTDYTQSHSETVTISEPSILRALTKTPTETVTMTDSIVKAITRTLSETAITIMERFVGRFGRASSFSRQEPDDGNWTRVS